MYLDDNKIGVAFLQAHEILKELKVPFDDEVFVDIQQLREVIARRSGLRIEMIHIPFQATLIRGRMERYSDGSARIHIRQNDQDDNWKRFVAAKELLHLGIDGVEDLSPYGDQTLEQLVLDGHFGAMAMEEDGKPPVQSEVIAQIAALEVLYPLGERGANIQLLSEQKTTPLKLAQKYGIPSHFISTAHHLPYLKKLIDAMNALEAKKPEADRKRDDVLTKMLRTEPQRQKDLKRPATPSKKGDVK